MKKQKFYIFIALTTLFIIFIPRLSTAQSAKSPTTTAIEVFTIKEDSKAEMVTTCKGLVIPRQQLQAELRSAYYPGPWDTQSELAAYARAACPERPKPEDSNCLVCSFNKWRLISGNGQCQKDFPVCDPKDSKTFEGCTPTTQKPQDDCDLKSSDKSTDQDKCFVCDMGNWRLESGDGRCHAENPPVCKVDDEDTFGGCKGGGAQTGAVCETGFKSSLNLLQRFKSNVAGVSVARQDDGNYALNPDTQNSNEEFISVKPCTKDGQKNPIQDIFLNLSIAKVNTDGTTSLVSKETRFPNCDVKKISRNDLGDLSQLSSLEVNAAYFSEDSENYLSSAANTVSLKTAKASSEKKTFVNVAKFPENVTLADKEVYITAFTNTTVANPSFEITNNTTKSNIAVTSDNQTSSCQGSGICFYRIKLTNLSGTYSIKFCSNEICDITYFASGANAENAANAGQTGNIQNSTDIQRIILSISNMPETELPLNGNLIDVDLAFELQNKTDAVGFLKVYYKDGNYNILPLKFNLETIPDKESGSNPFEKTVVLNRLRKAGKISETDQLVSSDIAQRDILPIVKEQGKLGTTTDILDVLRYTNYPVKIKRIYFENSQKINLPDNEGAIRLYTADCDKSSDYLEPYDGQSLKQNVPAAYVDKMLTHHLSSGEADPTLYWFTASGLGPPFGLGVEEVWDFEKETIVGRFFTDLFSPPLFLRGSYLETHIVSLIMANTGGEVPQDGPFYVKYPKGYIPLNLYSSEINLMRNKLRMSGKSEDGVKSRPYKRFSCSDGDFLEVNSILPYP